MSTPKIDGQYIIEMGYRPGRWFGEAIAAANIARSSGSSEGQVRALIQTYVPQYVPEIPLKEIGTNPVFCNLYAKTDEEVDNVNKVMETMREVARTPMVDATAVLPDACPAGPLGTIPVGGVVRSKAIHPGMHSADVCCSVMISIFANTYPKELLDAVQEVTHFGGGGRTAASDIVTPRHDILDAIKANRFLGNSVLPSAISHHATQGDGNHFAFVGRLRSTGETCLVTHHGSRKPGAMLYKAGLKAAIEHTRKISPETLKQNSWIDAESGEGEEYWDALQIMREWTKSNHQAIHHLASDKVQAITIDQFWNEHNFVFQRNGWFYHAKGATPGWSDFADDTFGQTLVPLNMAEPILITQGRDAPGSLGFLPHGAGRNMSRTQFEKANAHRTVEGQIEEETAGIDARFWIGKPDRSELPSAYKNADDVVKQIRQYRLARVVDYVDPYGSIMAGDCYRPRKKVRK